VPRICDMSMVRVSALGLGGVLSLAGLVAHAQVDARRELIQRGVAARDGGNHAAALDLFERAGTIEMRPGLRLSIAQEQQVLGRTRAACESASQCVSELQSTLGSPESARIMPACAELAAQTCTAVARIRVVLAQSLAEGESLVVGGRPVTVTEGAVTVFVDAGSVRVELFRTGQVALSQSVDAHAGAMATVSLENGGSAHVAPTQPVPSVPTQRMLPTALSTTGSSPVSNTAPPPATPRSARSPITGQWWFWTLVSAVVIGGTMGGLAAGGVLDYRGSPREGTAYMVNAIQAW
jgi:hypothetical protein